MTFLSYFHLFNFELIKILDFFGYGNITLEDLLKSYFNMIVNTKFTYSEILKMPTIIKRTFEKIYASEYEKSDLEYQKYKNLIKLLEDGFVKLIEVIAKKPIL